MDELKAKATQINSLLSKYIVLHDAFIKSSGSFWSIFKKINFASMSGDAYFLFEQLRDERNAIEKLKSEASDGKEKEFAESLYQYTKALTETVHLLFMLLHALSEKAKGEKLSMSEHMENNKKYQQSIERYMECGEELNKVYATL
jgi:hypothetical protein